MRGTGRALAAALVVTIALIASGIVAGQGTARATNLATGAVTINGKMEGNLKVNSGNTLQGGFDFNIPGKHPADTVYGSGTVTIHLSCTGDGTQDVSIPVSYGTTVPANSPSWYPSDKDSDPSTWMGSQPASCTGDAHLGATFNATFSASAPNKVCIRFHYRDVQAGDKGGWSGTVCVVPGPCTAYTCPASMVVNTSGTVQMQLTGTRVVLRGTASRSAIKSQAYLARVSVRNTPRHGIAFKVFATRHFPSLHLAHRGSLYGYNVASAKWHTVRLIAGSGIYAAVLR